MMWGPSGLALPHTPSAFVGRQQQVDYFPRCVLSDSFWGYFGGKQAKTAYLPSSLRITTFWIINPALTLMFQQWQSARKKCVCVVCACLCADVMNMLDIGFNATKRSFDITTVGYLFKKCIATFYNWFCLASVRNIFFKCFWTATQQWQKCVTERTHKARVRGLSRDNILMKCYYEGSSVSPKHIYTQAVIIQLMIFILR